MKHIYAGIDIGSSYVKVVLAAPSEKPDVPMQVLATTAVPSRGMRQGYITDTREMTRAIREAVVRASQAARVPVIKSARVALGGTSLEETRSTAEITLTASGGIVSERDMERVLRECESKASSRLTNRTLIHLIPNEFRLDGTPLMGRPAGMQGTKLAVDALLIHILAQHHDDIIEAVEAAGVEVEGVMASPLAASLVTLTKAQKTAGVCLANIGAETLSIVVFDNDMPVSLKVFPIGAAAITENLALSFQIPLTEAEQIKRGAVIGSTITPRKVATAVNAKLKEMFLLINDHLKSIKRERLLPAGIVITGGGASLAQAADVAKKVLRLPATIGIPAMTARTVAIDATWAVALGLCRWGYAENANPRSHTLSELLERIKDGVRHTLRSFLP